MRKHEGGIAFGKNPRHAGSYSPLVSSMMLAPAAMHNRATSTPWVSTEYNIPGRVDRLDQWHHPIKFLVGADRGTAPERTPPTSTKSAPSPTAAIAAPIARSSSNVAPLSKKDPACG